jgi:hypothetical protein
MAKAQFNIAPSSDPTTSRRGLVEDLAALVVCRFRHGGLRGQSDAPTGSDGHTPEPHLQRHSTATSLEPSTRDSNRTSPT